MVLRVDRGAAKHLADRRGGGQAAVLADDVVVPCGADDLVHGQEVGGIAELVDQPQLMCRVGGNACRGAGGPPPP